MPLDEAAAFLITCGTSCHALKDRAGPKAGERLLVPGAGGGVGLAAVELGQAMGAKVIAAASSDEKLASAKTLGADQGLVYPRGPLDREAQKALSAQFKGPAKVRGPMASLTRSAATMPNPRCTALLGVDAT